MIKTKVLNCRQYESPYPKPNLGLGYVLTSYPERLLSKPKLRGILTLNVGFTSLELHETHF